MTAGPRHTGTSPGASRHDRPDLDGVGVGQACVPGHERVAADHEHGLGVEVETREEAATVIGPGTSTSRRGLRSRTFTGPSRLPVETPVPRRVRQRLLGGTARISRCWPGFNSSLKTVCPSRGTSPGCAMRTRPSRCRATDANPPAGPCAARCGPAGRRPCDRTRFTSTIVRRLRPRRLPRKYATATTATPRRRRRRRPYPSPCPCRPSVASRISPNFGLEVAAA